MNIRKSALLSFFVFFLFTAFIPLTEIEAAGKLPKDTTIANVSVDGLTAEEAKIRLQEEITNWYAGEDLTAESEYETITIPRNTFVFDIDTSIKNMEERTKRHWSTFFMKKKNVHLPLEVNINDSVEVPDYIDVDTLLEKAATIASNLGNEVISIDYKEDPMIYYDEMARVEFPISMLSEATITHIANQLNGLIIPAKEHFSFLESITLLDSLEDYEDEMNLIASAIYKAALHTNLEILERHSQRIVPAYTDPGMEAKVSFGEELDMVLYNPNEYGMNLYAVIENNTFIFALESISAEETTEYFIKNKVEVEPKTITRFSSDLAPGTKETIQAGSNGLQLEVHRAYINEQGEEELELLARDYYPPQPKIVVISSKEEPELTASDLADLTEITGEFSPERLISSYVIGQGNRNSQDEKDENESNEEEVSEVEFESSLVDLFTWLMLLSLLAGEDMEEMDEGSIDEKSIWEDGEFWKSMLGSFTDESESLTEDTMTENSEDEME